MRNSIKNIHNRIRTAAAKAGRNPNEISLVAVSKRKSVDRICEAVAAGQLNFGENYLQDAIGKIPSLDDNLIWHFIGHIQSNKAKQIAELFDVVHTVDRLKIAKVLNNRLAQLNKVMSVYIQVNISREDQKSGVSPEELEPLVSNVLTLPHLKFAGLMAMPPYGEDPEKSRPYFRAMRKLANKLADNRITNQDNKIGLSMGMTGDYEIAVEEGSTLVRVGTAIFGERD